MGVIDTTNSKANYEIYTLYVLSRVTFRMITLGVSLVSYFK